MLGIATVCLSLVLVPFYRGAVVFEVTIEMLDEEFEVLVPFYRGAVVFLKQPKKSTNGQKSSRPLLSRSGCILVEKNEEAKNYNKFSSPFIEERLYLT